MSSEPPAARSDRASTLDSVPGDDPARVLVVEDDHDVGELIAAGLERHGHSATLVRDAAGAWQRLEHDEFDLVILDVRLPGESGLDLCRRLRVSGELPIIMVSGAGSLADRVAGFDAGADDYVVKPVHPAELGRRVDAVLRRARRPSPPSLLGPRGLELDVRAGEAVLGDRRVRLTRSEVGLLGSLLGRAGAAVPAEDLCRQVWGYEAVADPNFLQQHISRLRRKLRSLGLMEEIIRTVYGVGYRVDSVPPDGR